MKAGYWLAMHEEVEKGKAIGGDSMLCRTRHFGLYEGLYLIGMSIRCPS